MFDFFKNYQKYREMEINNAKNHTEKKLTLREKIIYCVMIIFCLVGFFLNFDDDNFLLNHTDLIILMVMAVIYGIMQLKKRK